MTGATDFTPVASLLGGGMIGLGAVLLMLASGRIMGATGILTGAIFGNPKGEVAGHAGRDWRLALLAGMVTGPLVVLLATGDMPQIDVPVSLPMLLVGGLLVGLGVSYGAGCTSGHGVCGMARLSQRSIVATITFMITTGITVWVVRHGLGG